MTGNDLVIFIQKHHLEEVDEIVLDDDTINFNITFESGDWLMYSLFDFGNGAQGDVVFWPGPNNHLGLINPFFKVSFEDAMKMREADKVTDEYLVNHILRRKKVNKEAGNINRAAYGSALAENQLKFKTNACEANESEIKLAKSKDFSRKVLEAEELSRKILGKEEK